MVTESIKSSSLNSVSFIYRQTMNGTKESYQFCVTEIENERIFHYFEKPILVMHCMTPKLFPQFVKTFTLFTSRVQPPKLSKWLLYSFAVYTSCILKFQCFFFICPSFVILYPISIMVRFTPECTSMLQIAICTQI